MILDGARIYNEGVEVGHDTEEKIRQIVNALKAFSPTSEVSMRFLKTGHIYEGLLWGKTHDVPIGIYNRGPSITHVLDTLQRRVKKECLKVLKRNGLKHEPKRRFSESPMAIAS